MTTNERLARTMSAWLQEDAGFRVPDHLDEVLAATRVTRQRPAWSSLERWLPVDTTFRPRYFTVPSGARLIAVAALLLLIAAIAILAVGSQQRLPEPFGLARNGTFVTTHDGDIYAIDATTSEERLLIGGDSFDFGAFFSRDGTRFMFLRSDGPPADPAILTLMIANADGSDARAVTPPTESLDWFDWSPDGTRIAYMATGNLYVVDVAGGAPQRLKGTGRVHYPTWLPPDGDEIVYRAVTSSPAIFAIPADGTGKRRAISRAAAQNEFDYETLAVAPDGRRIAFTRWSEDAVPSLHALDVASGEEIAYPSTAAGQLSPAYSPDGSLIAYTAVEENGALRMAVANADGTGGERVLGPTQPALADGSFGETFKSFTPDGTALVVRYGNDDASTTYLLPVDGSPARNLGAGGFQFIDVQRLAP